MTQNSIAYLVHCTPVCDWLHIIVDGCIVETLYNRAEESREDFRFRAAIVQRNEAEQRAYNWDEVIAAFWTRNDPI